MGRYCEECKDCYKGKNCVVTSSSCISYDLEIPDISPLSNVDCVSIEDTTKDIYNLIKDLKKYNTIDYTALKASCNKINYNNTTSTITQNEVNIAFNLSVIQIRNSSILIRSTN